MSHTDAQVRVTEWSVIKIAHELQKIKPQTKPYAKMLPNTSFATIIIIWKKKITLLTLTASFFLYMVDWIDNADILSIVIYTLAHTCTQVGKQI